MNPHKRPNRSHRLQQLILLLLKRRLILIRQLPIGLARQMLPINPQLLPQLPRHLLLRGLELRLLLLINRRIVLKNFKELVKLPDDFFGQNHCVLIDTIMKLCAH